MDTSALNRSKHHRVRMQCGHILEICESLIQGIFWIISLSPLHCKFQNIWAELSYDHMVMKMGPRLSRMDHTHLCKIFDRDVSLCNLEEIVYMVQCIFYVQRRGSRLLDDTSLGAETNIVSVY
jgi:hypothetical protein